MHLKSLELIGFKSFENRTTLEFSEGITAIVGPNGCGKSNLSDAIRWVLGEQSARLLRGSKMEDCIFNGTDARKPLGMAEVSLTFTDCEKTLGTEYHEITVTRRVLRSGEGQYFINKTPCRLKDIQRLFMDTGIGTNSYSLMEQGRIDLILRSRPEDRREVFEEASGITKYKSDKREALRKLEQTENNLLRLADIIKEVKRQIISLQRQAGKAARYKKLFEEMRSLDVFASRERLQHMRDEIRQMEETIAALDSSIASIQAEIQRHEQQNEELRDALAEAERDMTVQRQADMEQRAQLERARQAIEINQKRIHELENLTEREKLDINTATRELENDRQNLEKTKARLIEIGALLQAAETELKQKSQANALHENSMDESKHATKALLEETMALDDRQAKLQNELRHLENEDHQVASRRERCAAEQSSLKMVLENHTRRLAESATLLQQLMESATHTTNQLREQQAEQTRILAEIKTIEATRSDHRAQVAALAAQINILNKNLQEKTDFSKPIRQLLDNPAAFGMDSQKVLGVLAAQIEAENEYRPALESALRFWLDAVVVSNRQSAHELLLNLSQNHPGAARLLAAEIEETALPAAPTPQIPQATPLLDHVKCPAGIQPLLRRLLTNVWIVDSIEKLPEQIPAQAVLVTRQGALIRGCGAFETYDAEKRGRNPLGLRHQLADLQRQLEESRNAEAATTQQLQQHNQHVGKLNEVIKKTQLELESRRQTLARREGEQETVQRQETQVRDNLETVTYELRELEKHDGSTERKSAIIAEIDHIRARRAEIKQTLEQRNAELGTLEQEHRLLLNEVTAASVRAAQHRQAQEHLNAQHQPLAARIQQLENMLNERAERIRKYADEISDINRQTEQAHTSIPALEETLRANLLRINSLQEQREKQALQFKTLDDRLKQLRAETDTHRARKNEFSVAIAEARLKREHIEERLASEYRLVPEAIAAEPEPEWPPEGRPTTETIEIQIAELRAKIEAMGQVNTGAIAEYQELQERFNFLTHQQDDLVKSKQQLMEMIRKINQTTTEMFAATFAKINENFQAMFNTLFGGGTAKLILTDEEDILDCGIEIYARPPGKKLQSISLMSGGESTMTAVALLFAIYMVKPSPFCLLDEMDAALDDSNIHRFIKVVKGFVTQSQFLIITHNRQTISAAKTLYGVTMEADKVSRIVSMKFTDQRVEQTTAGQAAPAAPQSAPVAAGAAIT